MTRTCDEPFEIDAELGNLSLRVQGEDPEWVEQQFNRKLKRMLDEAEDVSKALREGSRSCQ